MKRLLDGACGAFLVLLHFFPSRATTLYLSPITILFFEKTIKLLLNA